MKKFKHISIICNKYKIINYSILDNGLIDVIGDVDLSNLHLKKLPIKFNSVSGSFFCENNNLSSLLGCPNKIGIDFCCSNNSLTQLTGLPKLIPGSLCCQNNKLINLIGCSEAIGYNLYILDNNINSLNGIPKFIGGDFNCVNNNLSVIDIINIKSIILGDIKSDFTNSMIRSYNLHKILE